MWQFWKGYVIIQIEGLYAARLIARLTENGFRVYALQRLDETSLRCTVSVKCFFAIRTLRKGLHVRIRVLSRGGLPFLAKRLFRRPVLWIGTAAVLILLSVLSSRIWVIRIGKTERVDPDEIRSLLAERGIRPGAFLEGPILITAANDLSAQIRDAAWIGLDREGVMLKVNVVEALPVSPKKTVRVPSDVVAQKDGIVTSIDVMRGQARVKPGDRVKAGDVLISGTVDYKGERYGTNADGTVRGSVFYESEAAVSDTVTESFETDTVETVRVIRIGPWEIVRQKPSFSYYRLIRTTSRLTSDLLPIVLETYEAREIDFRERTLDEEEAAQNALATARESALSAVPKDAAVINIYGTIRTKNGKRFAFVIVTAEETIGKTEEDPHDG